MKFNLDLSKFSNGPGLANIPDKWISGYTKLLVAAGGIKEVEIVDLTNPTSVCDNLVDMPETLFGAGKLCLNLFAIQDRVAFNFGFSFCISRSS